jgi:Trypsin
MVGLKGSSRTWNPVRSRAFVRCGATLLIGLLIACTALVSSAGAARSVAARSGTSTARLSSRRGWEVARLRGVGLAARGHHALVHSFRQARSPRTPRAHNAIVGGSQISIDQAPWQVLVLGAVPIEAGTKVEFLSCGGSILDATHILTVAHCVFDPETGAPLPAENVAVVAGVSDIDSSSEVSEQFSEAASLRVHPYFKYAEGPGTADDVAVITLAKALSLSSDPGSAVSSISMSATGQTPAEGTRVNLTGFGQEQPSTEPDGLLHALGMTVGYSRECGHEADALFICANAPDGSGCNGDSGSGLTSGLTPALVGVMDTVAVVSGERCRDDANNGFVDLMAPEIRDFIEGNESPPRAPRGGGAAIEGVTRAGRALVCDPGKWSNEPTFTYSFINSSNGQVLQQGLSPVYGLSAADVGRTIYCEVQASSAGGTGIGHTPALPAIEEEAITAHGPQPTAPVAPSPTATAPETGYLSLASTSVKARSSGTAGVELNCFGIDTCRGELKLTATGAISVQGKRKKRHIEKLHDVTIATLGFSIEGDETKGVDIELDSTGRALLGADHGHLSASLAIIELAPGSQPAQSEVVSLTEPKPGHKSKPGHKLKPKPHTMR